MRREDRVGCRVRCWGMDFVFEVVGSVGSSFTSGGSGGSSSKETLGCGEEGGVKKVSSKGTGMFSVSSVQGSRS